MQSDATNGPDGPDEPGRRTFLGLAAGLAAAPGLGLGELVRLLGGDGGARGRLGFASIPPSLDDGVHLAEGYAVQVFAPWGTPLDEGAAWAPDASDDAAAQRRQVGMHHDGMEYFALEPTDAAGRTWEQRGLLALNHEYLDNGLLHADGATPWTAEKAAKARAAVGVSVLEVGFDGERWQLVRPSRLARRVDADTPMVAGGPAAARIAAGLRGTFANCSSGRTPWGTYVTCEENIQDWFAWHGPEGAAVPERLARYGLWRRGSFYGLEIADERFDAARHPEVFEQFGWVVELDPEDPDHVPVKRTGLGRFAHENACVVLAEDGRVVTYQGDDRVFEFLYKFVSAGRYDPEATKAANGALLDEGTLYAARLDADGTGEWLPLVHDTDALRERFTDQADVLVHARLAATAVGATPMDRPEWVVQLPAAGDRPAQVFVSLTNNTARGGEGRPGPDAANPRADNAHGGILRWSEAGGDAAATRFRWDHFLLCGDPDAEGAAERGTTPVAFGSPDGMMVDGRGLLWIQTDVSTPAQGQGRWAAFGNNQVLCADPDTGEVRRFLTGPRRCEMTGITATPDGTTLFVNVQHPGEPSGRPSDPTAPLSDWPDGPAPEGAPPTRPRSATLAIRRLDGGVVGAPREDA